MAVYVATHKPATMPASDWLVPLGVGGYRGDAVAVTDDHGDHISHLNRLYCELTATYWIWRNRADPYLGLCHYRRAFAFQPLPVAGLGGQAMVRAPAAPEVLGWLASPAQRARMELLLERFGMVVPQPVQVWPSVANSFREAHGADIWDSFIAACRDELGAQATATLEVETRFYPCNMMVARRDVFDEYCSVLFKVIGRVVSEVGDRPEVPGARYQPYRYPGYLGERFTSLYLIATGTPHTTAQIVCLE